jgi:hypothetical protein
MIPGFQHTGTWYDYFTGEALNVSDVGAFMSFQPGEYHVYVDQPVNFPSAIAQPTQQAIAVSAYPNPAAGTFSIAYPEQVNPANIEVYDLNGRNVGANCTIASKIGSHTVAVDAAGLPMGVYTVRASSETSAYTTRIVLANNR